MAQQGPTRSIVAMIFRNFFNSLKPRKWSGELRGVDYMGTKYFEIPANPSTGKRKASRWFEPINGDDNFDQELPSEWEAWLRGRRKQPPTEEEVNKNYQMMLLKKERAKAIDALAGEKTPMKKGMESFPQRPEYEIVPGKPKEGDK